MFKKDELGFYWRKKLKRSCLCVATENYSKTCVNDQYQKDQKWSSRPSIAQCRSKVFQNAPKGAFCNTFDLH